jgi:alkylhydroperoxidase family enzyme
MAPRIDVTKYPDALKAMYGLERITRERAALEWAKTLTLIAPHYVPDELYARTREHLTDGLTLAVIAINGWNRLSIPFRAEVGSYQPGTGETAAAALASA